MATSLQKQLAKIATKSTHQLDLKTQRAAHGKSLLFEPKVASSQDFNSLYRICSDGFEDLCSLDPRFKVFARSIFSEQSRSEERGLMTEAENKDLDIVLEDFLVLVAGRLLLKPAQKAVEWLIRRFRVHELNTECLVLSFLPYHTTPLFLSLLSILPKQIPQNLRFLYPSISVLQNPTFHTVLYTATNNPAFFTAFNNFILRACRVRHQSPAIMSFWASLTTQAVDGMLSASQSGRETVQRQRKEDLFLRLLPMLNEALSSQLADVNELVMAACMIVTVLGAKGHLEDHLTDALMEAVTVKFTPSTTEARVTCLAVLAEQRHTLELTVGVARRLLKLEGLAQHLLRVSQNMPSGRLVLGLIVRAMQSGNKKQLQLSMDDFRLLLKGNVLPDDQVRVLLEKSLQLVSESTNSFNLSEQQRNIISSLFEFASESPGLQKSLQQVLETSNTDQMRIELALQTTLALPLQIPSSKVSTDGDEGLAEIPAVDAHVDQAFAQLEKHELSCPSFLSVGDSDDYAIFKSTFMKALISEEHLKHFLQLPALSPEGRALSTPATTFLLRLMNDGSMNQLARTTALRSLQRLIRQEANSSLGVQFVLPYLIALMAERSSNIRQAAAEAILALTDYFKVTSQSNSPIQPLGNEDIYVWNELSAINFKVFVEKVLFPNLEEAVLDPNSIAVVVSGLLSSNKAIKDDVAGLICKYLASHIVGTPLQSVKLRLLHIINKVNQTAADARKQILRPMLHKWLTTPLVLIDIEQIQLSSHSELALETFRTLTVEDEGGLRVLETIISRKIDNIRPEMARPAFQRLVELWDGLPAKEGEKYAKLLLEAALDNFESPQSDLYRELASETIRNIRLPGHTLKALVDDLPKSINLPDAPPAKKRRRTSKSEMVRATAISSTDIAAALAKYTLVLELVENSKPQEQPELLKGLFGVLEEIQQYRLQTQSGLVYLQGLAISCLLTIVDRLKETQNTAIDTSSIRTDLIVDCIRHSTNTQVQSSALLLISSLASWQPETVVHSIMPIFTFMGNTILRQGDDYSAHVTEKTLSQVVPPLVESFRVKNTDIIRGAANLLLSFTAAFEHIPSQRRLALFEHLTRTVGPEESLFATLAMLIDGYPTDSRAKKFVVELMNQFEPSINLATIRQFLNLVGDMYRQRPTTAQHVLNLSERPKETYEIIASNLLQSLAKLLEDRQLRSRMSQSFRSGDLDTANAQRFACVQLIQESIRLSHFLRSKPILSHLAGVVLSDIINLLPIIELVQCAGTLLAQNDNDVRLVAIRTINTRVQDSGNPTSDEVLALLNFIPQLSTLLSSSQSWNLSSEAIECIGIIARKFGKKDISTVTTAAQIVSNELALKHKDPRVQISSIECLITMTEVLKDEFIPLVPKILPTIFQYLRFCLNQVSDSESTHDLPLIRSCFVALNAIIGNLPFLITGENLDTVLQSAAEAAGSDLFATKTKDLRSNLHELLAKDINADELFSAFERNTRDVVALGGFEALIEYLAAFKLALSARPKSAVIRNVKTLFDLLIQAFDFRRLAASAEPSFADFDEEDMDQLQDIYNDIALNMVMKLNDATFRPFIVKMAVWATSLPKKESDGRMLRATSLFSFLSLLFGRLKSLVTSYATYILDLATEILVNTSPSSTVEVNLLAATLSALGESFTHDDEQFWQSPHHFNSLALPLISLLQAASQASSDAITSKAQSTVISLAASTSSNDQHKSLNTALLKLLRHEDPNVRLVAVKTERVLSERLGEEWLGMLPEMMPLIAEVLEDEDRAVERAGRDWVRYLEGVLGENLEF